MTTTVTTAELANVLQPHEAGRWIAETSEDVKIIDAGVKSLAEHVSYIDG